MRKAIFVTALVFSIGLGLAIGSRMSTEAMAIVVGATLAVAIVSVATILAVVVFTARAEVPNPPRYPTYPTYPTPRPRPEAPMMILPNGERFVWDGREWHPVVFLEGGHEAH